MILSIVIKIPSELALPLGIRKKKCLSSLYIYLKLETSSKLIS